MDKIKNILNPGKSKDDEVLYGSGQSDDPVHAGTGTQATTSLNTHEPISSSTGPAGNTARDPIGQGGIGSIQQGSTPVSSSRMPGMFDEDVGSTSSIKSGVPGSSQESRVIGAPETHDPLDTNKPLPREPTAGGTQGYGSSTTSGAGPHSSSLANKADPRVDSDLDGYRGLETQGTPGTSGSLTGGSLPDRTVENAGSTTSDPGRSFPLGGAAAAGTTTSGPHTSNLANKADPRVDSDRDGSGGLGSTGGYGTGTGATAGSVHQGDLSRSGAGATGATTGESNPIGYSEKTWAHDHGAHGHEYVGDPCENEPPAPGAVHFIPGPHSLDTANRLDPHVSGGGIGLESATATDPSTSSTGHHHPGRDAALGAGVGAAGVRAYEASRDTPSSSTLGSGHHSAGRDTGLGGATGTIGAGTYESGRDVPSGSTTQPEMMTAGPHKSDMMNKLDPRVNSDLSKQQETSATTGTTGVGNTSTTDPFASREHHTGRDAALAGAGGAAVYEGAKHHGHDVTEGTPSSGYGTRERDIPQGTSSSGYANPYPPGSSGTGVGSGPTSSSTYPSSSTGTAVGSGPTSSTTGATTSADPTSTGKDHHYGRDAGIGGAGAGVGAGAAYEANKHFGGSHGDTSGARSTGPISSQQPLSGTSGPDYGRDTGLTGVGSAGNYDSRHKPTATSGVASQPPIYDERSRPQESHTGRDAALGAGAGAAAVVGGEELSRKDLEKEQKAAHKQEEKAAKQHQHEVEKAEKKHHHDLEQAEKAHEKKLEKDEAKHRKDEPQEGEKKHHGLFGFLHRDKPDKDLKEEEAARKARLEEESHPGVGTAATSAGGAIAGTEGLSELEKHERAKEHDRNRLHKDPPPGYADPPTKGYASEVTGGTGTTALAQGGPVSSGSHFTALGNQADPSIAGRGDTVDSNKTRDSEGRVIEPHTGLPLDLSKGDGAGGTDSTPIHGYHPAQSGTDGATTGTGSGGEGFGHFQDHAR